MATVTYINNTSPISGLNFNPSLYEVLDQNGSITQHNSSLFEITNTSTGPFAGFKVQLTSSANDFFYFIILTNPITVTNSPIAGKIDGITVRAPDGTIVMQVTAGANGFLDKDLVDFGNRLFSSTNPANAVKNALDNLLGNSNVQEGSSIGDHMVTAGFSHNTLTGNGGNDFMWARGDDPADLIGGAGNDLIRVEDGNYTVHGALADGTGGAGETDTLEIVASVSQSNYARITEVSNIDAIRFVALDHPVAPAVDGAEMGMTLNVSQIKDGGISLNLVVDGSAAESPFSENHISIFTGYDAGATTGVNLDLSGWTFRDWNSGESYIEIKTNYAARDLRDTIVGTKVGDLIATYYGDDTIRGGGGADYLDGGNGNDTFIYGRNEAVDGELVGGGQGAGGGTADTVLILADNDFSGVSFYGIDQFVFAGPATATFGSSIVNGLNPVEETRTAAPPPAIVGDAKANTVAFQLDKSGGGSPSIDLVDLVFKSWSDKQDRVKITGTKSIDSIIGSTKGDTIDGGLGGDTLQGNAGADTFVFSAGLGGGVDHIADFSRKQGDRIYLDEAMFSKLKAGKIKKSAFEIGEKADSRKDRIIYDKEDGILRYDDDGTGKHKAKVFAVLDDAATLKAGDLMVI
jgi:Ca2+-binding RTX toxin-like protein